MAAAPDEYLSVLPLAEVLSEPHPPLPDENPSRDTLLFLYPSDAYGTHRQMGMFDSSGLEGTENFFYRLLFDCMMTILETASQRGILKHVFVELVYSEKGWEDHCEERVLDCGRASLLCGDGATMMGFAWYVTLDDSADSPAHRLLEAGMQRSLQAIFASGSAKDRAEASAVAFDVLRGNLFAKHRSRGHRLVCGHSNANLFEYVVEHRSLTRMYDVLLQGTSFVARVRGHDACDAQHRILSERESTQQGAGNRKRRRGEPSREEEAAREADAGHPGNPMLVQQSQALCALLAEEGANPRLARLLPRLRGYRWPSDGATFRADECAAGLRGPTLYRLNLGEMGTPLHNMWMIGARLARWPHPRTVWPHVSALYHENPAYYFEAAGLPRRINSSGKIGDESSQTLRASLRLLEAGLLEFIKEDCRSPPRAEEGPRSNAHYPVPPSGTHHFGRAFLDNRRAIVGRLLRTRFAHCLNPSAPTAFSVLESWRELNLRAAPRRPNVLQLSRFPGPPDCRGIVRRSFYHSREEYVFCNADTVFALWSTSRPFRQRDWASPLQEDQPMSKKGLHALLFGPAGAGKSNLAGCVQSRQPASFHNGSSRQTDAAASGGSLAHEEQGSRTGISFFQDENNCSGFYAQGHRQADPEKHMHLKVLLGESTTGRYHGTERLQRDPDTGAFVKEQTAARFEFNFVGNLNEAGSRHFDPTLLRRCRSIFCGLRLRADGATLDQFVGLQGDVRALNEWAADNCRLSLLYQAAAQANVLAMPTLHAASRVWDAFTTQLALQFPQTRDALRLRDRKGDFLLACVQLSSAAAVDAAVDDLPEGQVERDELLSLLLDVEERAVATQAVALTALSLFEHSVIWPLFEAIAESLHDMLWDAQAGAYATRSGNTAVVTEWACCERGRLADKLATLGSPERIAKARARSEAALAGVVDGRIRSGQGRLHHWDTSKWSAAFTLDAIQRILEEMPWALEYRTYEQAGGEARVEFLGGLERGDVTAWHVDVGFLETWRNASERWRAALARSASAGTRARLARPQPLPPPTVGWDPSHCDELVCDGPANTWDVEARAEHLRLLCVPAHLHGDARPCAEP